MFIKQHQQDITFNSLVVLKKPTSTWLLSYKLFSQDSIRGSTAIMFTFMLLLIFASASLAVDEDSMVPGDRKVWSTCVTSNNGSGITQCRCGNSLDAVICSDNGNILHVQPCYCMFYEESGNKTLAGNCMITCYNGFFTSVTRYSIQNGSLLNEDMCSSRINGIDTHREGRFCGRCKKDYGLAVYSYHYTECIPCKNYSYINWLRYFAVALLPLTVFYFFVLLLKINICSSRLSGSVLAIQCWLSPLQLRVFDGWIMYNDTMKNISLNNISFRCFNVILSLLGMVNLDFFRTLYPYFCLHPKLSILHVVSLDFIVALYPFVLIFLTYLLVTMHDKNYRLVIWVWKPFKFCIERYQRQFNLKGSLIEVFATFILLSNVKILGVCFDLLVPTRVYDETGSKKWVHFLYYDANIEYFSLEHLPFALLALIIGFVFVTLPLLLLVLYPCHCFQKFLNSLGLKCQALHIFMDAFQGGYKTRPYDLRIFSAYHLLLRFLILLTLATESVFYLSSTAILLIVGGIVFAAFQPYKNSSHNKLTTIVLFTMVMFYTGISSSLIAEMLDPQWLTLSEALIVVSFIFILAIAFVPVVLFFRSFSPLRSTIKKITICIGKKQRQDSSTSLLTDIQEDRDVRLSSPSSLTVGQFL